MMYQRNHLHKIAAKTSNPDKWKEYCQVILTSGKNTVKRVIRLPMLSVMLKLVIISLKLKQPIEILSQCGTFSSKLFHRINIPVNRQLSHLKPSMTFLALLVNVSPEILVI